MRQCHGFENDSKETITVYLRHFLKLLEIIFPCNLIKATLNFKMDAAWSTFKLTA